MPDLTLNEYADKFAGLVCRWDGAKLTGKVDHYNHTGGQPVSGFEMPQWLSMRCTKCGYDWSLNKLPILQAHTQKWIVLAEPERGDQ